MSIFSKAKKKLRSKARDELSAGLQKLGLSTEISERDRPEEKFTSWRGDSLGVINIEDEHIRWVNLKRRVESSKNSTRVHWYSEYGIPDPRLTPRSPEISLKTIRKKSFPIFGRVHDVEWSGKDFDLGLESRLENDPSIKQTIMKGRDVELQAKPEHGCWIMTVRRKETPSRDQWACYKTIAQHALSIPMPA